MFTIRNRWVVGSIFLLLFSAALSVHVQNALAVSGSPDATLFTTYRLFSADQTVSWSVCGSTALSEGCYASGDLGPFGKAGALIEGNPSVNLSTNTVTRRIYVVDIASGSTGNGVVLYVYEKTDVVSSTSDKVTVTLLKTVILPLSGGSTASCSMAANNGFLFIGTDQSQQAVSVGKSKLTVTQLGGYMPGNTVTAMTADKYGYVTINWGQYGFYVYGPNGTTQEDGGGADFMLNTVTAVLTATLP
jgi:hypothetical protein